MAIDRTGELWTGTDAADLEEYLAAYSKDGYPVRRTVAARCGSCGGTVFAVTVDDEEGCAVRTCSDCADEHPMLDSAEYVDEADLEQTECPCGGEDFEVVAGFAFYDDSGDVRWVYLGLRCVFDGVLGCYADWKIDYSPTDHLLASV